MSNKLDYADDARYIECYAAARGVKNPICSFHYTKAGGGYWELRGEGNDRKNCPLVWRVADELKIHSGTGNADQVQISHPARAVFPPKPWEREITTMPVEAKKPERRYTPDQLKQQRLLEELTWALEILPDVVENLTAYPIESLEPFASRLICATVVLQSIEAKLYADSDDGDDDDDDDDGTDLFVETDSGESDKDAAIESLAQIGANIAG